MAFRVAMLLGALALFTGAFAQNISIPDSNIYAHVAGKSGNIFLGRTPKPASDPHGMRLRMVTLQEMDGEGNPVAATGQMTSRHGFPNFATQDFTFTSIEEVFLPRS